VYESEQPLFFLGRNIKRGECAMGPWIQARRELSNVELQIALLIFGVVATGAMLAYYFANLPQ
jgi:hypothetical protein